MDTFNQTTNILLDIIRTLRTVISQLEQDNQNLRTQLNLIYHRRENPLPNISTFIEIDEEQQQEQERGFRTYSIPPHIRQNYLQNLSPNQQCSICLDRINNENTMELTNCGHLFHAYCIRQHQENSNICPVCRQQLDHI